MYFKSKKRKMDNDIKWAIWEGITYIVLKYLWLNSNKPSTGADDKWDDLSFRKKIEEKNYSIYIQVKTTKNIPQNNNWIINYSLKKIKNYNDYTELNNEDFWNIWIILIVYLENENNLINITNENFTTYCKLYWYKPIWEKIEDRESISLNITNKQITNDNLDNILTQWIQ